MVAGGPGEDVLHGGPGNDWLDGDQGADSLDDVLRAVDGRRDVVDCGAGRDRAEVDPQDRVSGCEVVDRH